MGQNSRDHKLKSDGGPGISLKSCARGMSKGSAGMVKSVGMCIKSQGRVRARNPNLRSLRKENSNNGLLKVLMNSLRNRLRRKRKRFNMLSLSRIWKLNSHRICRGCMRISRSSMTEYWSQRCKVSTWCLLWTVQVPWALGSDFANKKFRILFRELQLRAKDVILDWVL